MSAIRPLHSDQVNSIKKVNFIITTGEFDEYQPVPVVRNAVVSLQKLGIGVEYFEYKNATHWSWLDAGGDENFLKLIFR
jgi:predicted esterase